MCSVASSTLAVNGIRHYAAYGTPFGFSGEQTDANGLVYLRARHYAPSLGIFPALDPFEGDPGRPMSLNGYSWVEGKVVNGAVGELIFHNRYSYANGNPVNLTDHSGLCAQPTQWWNPVDANCYYSAAGLAQRFSQGDPQTYNAWFDALIQKDWGELKAIEALGSVADVTGGAQQLLDNALTIPADPNPNRDPDGGWCRTIRRVIQEIDGAGYSERQLNRDLEAAGISHDTWNIIKEAVKAAAEACEDHWGDFTGGSLATG